MKGNSFTKDEALALALEAVKVGHVCENTRSRINFDIGLHFTMWTHMSPEQLSLILFGHIHRSQMSPTDIDSVIKRGIEKFQSR